VPQKLAQALTPEKGKNDPTLEELDLMNNSLGPEGARHIAGVLRSGNKRLKKINLYWNNIGNQGLEAICAGLSARTNYPRDFVLVGVGNSNLASVQDFFLPISQDQNSCCRHQHNTSCSPKHSVRIASALTPHPSSLAFLPLSHDHVFLTHDIALSMSQQDVRYNGFDRTDPSVNWELMEEQLKKSKLEYEGEPEKCRFRGWPQD